VADLPFGGLFQTHSLVSTRRVDGGLRWDFAANDLNESAKALFRHLDRVFEILKAPDFVFLSTIELDVEAGRFPDVLAQYFRDDAWADTQSFFVAPIKRSPASEYGPLGRLTFEAAPGQTVRALGQNGGFRWGSALRVWGLQISKDHVENALEVSTDNPRQLIEIQRFTRAAWLAADDLDALSLWISSSVDEHVRSAAASMP
jgi:hypothetical protein